MFNQWFPKEYVNSIYEIDYGQLYQKGIRGLLFDIDNTLAPYYIQDSEPTTIRLFQELKEKGFKICLVSNNNEERVLRFNQNLKVFSIPHAKKPLTRALKKGMSLMETQRKDTAMIGDQVFTDIWSGNRLNLYTILVVPITQKDEWMTAIKRGIEKKVIDAYLQKPGTGRRKR